MASLTDCQLPGSPPLELLEPDDEPEEPLPSNESPVAWANIKIDRIPYQANRMLLPADRADAAAIWIMPALDLAAAPPAPENGITIKAISTATLTESTAAPRRFPEARFFWSETVSA